MAENTNCLKGWKCPSCGQTDNFRVVSTHTIALVDDGTENIDGEEEYGDDSSVLCPVCDWLGIVAEVCI